MRQRTVLLLEDEPVIALDLREELEAGGCKVIAAADASDAVQLSLEHELDLAILNFRIKNMGDGMDLAHRMRLGPHTKLLFVTGANPQDINPLFGLNAKYQVLYKPFARRQLQAALLP